MPFLLLMLIAAACFPERWPQPLAWLGVSEGFPEWFAAATWTGVVGLIFLAWLNTWRTRRELVRDPGKASATLRRFSSRRRVLHAFQSVFLLVSVYVLGWGWTVQKWLTPEGGALLPGAELLVLAPLFVPLVLSWAIYYDAEHWLHDYPAGLDSEGQFSGRWSYVFFNLRQNLALLIAPLALLIIDKGMRRAFPGPAYEGYLQVVSVVLLVMVFVGLPWILRLALGLRPLPEGPVRDRLMACARRLRFRCSNILVWNTRGAVANAVVAGIVPQLRYVIFTDRLVSELTPDEVEAVFGHEVGHVKHHHMFFYIGFLLLSLGALAGAWVAARDYLWNAPQPQVVAAAADDRFEVERKQAAAITDREVIPLVAVMGAYVFIVFGFLSRRCERQADVFGCRAVSCPQPDCLDHDAAVALAPLGRGLCPTGIRIFIDALEKVASINGISRSRPGWLQSWQHSTIARRVEFLQRVLDDRREEARFQRRVALVKWGLLALLLTILGTLLATLGRGPLGLI